MAGAVNIPIIPITLVDAHIKDKRAVLIMILITIGTLKQLNSILRTVTSFKRVTLPEPRAVILMLSKIVIKMRYCAILGNLTTIKLNRTGRPEK